MQSQNQEQLQKIIKKQYKQREKLLNLQQQATLWINVLAHQDWSMLKELNLRTCNIKDCNIKVLSNKKWPQLRKLLLWNNSIGFDGVKKIMDFQIPKLQFLQLGKFSRDKDQNNIGNEGLQALIKNLRKQMNALQIAKNNINMVGIANILPYLPEDLWLSRINISQNKLGLVGIKMLLRVPLRHLEDLVMDCCELGPEAARFLTKANWPKLLYLHLEQNKIGFSGYDSIVHGGWSKLKYLTLGQMTPNDRMANIIDSISSLGLAVFETRDRTVQRKVSNEAISKEIKKLSNPY